MTHDPQAGTPGSAEDRSTPSGQPPQPYGPPPPQPYGPPPQQPYGPPPQQPYGPPPPQPYGSSPQPYGPLPQQHYGPPQHQPYGQPYPQGQGYPQPQYGPPTTYGQPYPPEHGGFPQPYQQYAGLPFGAPPLPPLPDPMPDGPREYQQLLRGPRRRWWRPLLAALLAGALYLLLAGLAVVPVILAAAAAGVDNPASWTLREMVDIANLGPAGFLYVNLSLIVLIPTAGLSIWVCHRIRPGFLSSVAGHIRWRWLLRCALVAVPVWLVYIGVSVALDPTTTPRPDQWALLLVIVVLLTPLQAAGEEYFFRGWIMQNVGAWFRHPVVGLVVGLVVSTGLFAAAHGSPDVWVIADLSLFALTAGILTWRTGGLEAAIVIHAVNNVAAFFVVILLGGWQQAFVGADTKSTFSAFAVSLLVHAVVLTLILWQAKRAGIERRYLPKPLPALPAPPSAAAAVTVG